MSHRAERPAISTLRQHAPGVDVIAIEGEHDVTSAALLRGTARRSQADLVLVDLSECDFLDSTIMKELLLAHRDVSAQGRRLELIVPPDSGVVAGLLRMSGLHRVLPIRESIEAPSPHS